MIDIHEKWKCENYDNYCYQKDKQHFPLNRWKLKMWAAAIVCSELHGLPMDFHGFFYNEAIALHFELLVKK